jgi:hypothetical protein
LYENIITRISINLIWESTICLEVYRSNPKAFLHSTEYIWKQQRRTQKAIGYTRRGTFSEYCPYELNIFRILILTLHFKNNCFSKCHFQNFFIGVFHRLFPLWSKPFWHILRFSWVGVNCSKFDCSTIICSTLLAANQLLDMKLINCSNPVNPGSTGFEQLTKKVTNGWHCLAVDTSF